MPESHKMTDEQKAMYTGICICRNNEVALQWARNQILIIINFGGLSFLGTRVAIPGLYLEFAIAGWMLAVYWIIVNWRTQQWIDYWQLCLGSMEPAETNILVFRVFTGTKWSAINKFPTFNFLLMALPIAFSNLWTIIFTIPFVL